MSAGFAGAKNVDERRRRRLAGFVEPSQLSPALFAPKKSLVENTPTVVTSTAAIPIGSIIPPERWKIAAVGLLGAALIYGSAELAGIVAHQDAAWGGAGRHLFSAIEGTCPRFARTMILFCSAMLAMIIRWIRQHSVRDFDGQFRSWTAVAIVCWTLSIGIGCHLPNALEQTAFTLGPWRFDLSPPWTWYAFLTGNWLVLTLLTWKELKRCRESLYLFICGLGLLIAHITLLHQHAQYPANLTLNQLKWISGTASGSAWCLFISLWLHARYVIYVSADPPEQKEKRMSTSRSSGIFSRIFSSLWPFGRSSSGEQPTIEGEPRIVPETVDTNIDGEDDSQVIGRGSRIDEQHNEADDRRSRQSRNRKRREHPDEAPIDKAMLKGLSKKERNRIRQQWRDELRSQKSNHEPAA